MIEHSCTELKDQIMKVMPVKVMPVLKQTRAGQRTRFKGGTTESDVACVCWECCPFLGWFLWCGAGGFLVETASACVTVRLPQNWMRWQSVKYSVCVLVILREATLCKGGYFPFIL